MSISLKQASAIGKEKAGVVCLNAETVCPGFTSKAEEHVLRYLKKHGTASGEDITDSCKKSGIVPHDDRAFGAVFSGLSRRKEIVLGGIGLRRKGHGTAGSRIWALPS